MFSIFPASGNVMPGAQQVINVECSADNISISDEEICIDISDRDPKLFPHGIPYRIQAESCIPAIDMDDIGAIFEEHRICKSLSLWQHYNKLESGGVYGEMEKKFMFNNVLVGKKSKARFKIINNTKVPCDVIMNLRTQAARGSGKTQHQLEAFEIEPVKAQILNHGHIFVTVTFAPQTMQMYTTTFEAVIDSSNLPFKIDGLTFDISGEGTLPRISVTQPMIRNRQGQPVLIFKQNLVGHAQALTLALTNDGTLPCKVDLDLIDTDKVYSLVHSADKNENMEHKFINGKVIQKKPYTATVSLECDDVIAFDVIFHPKQPVKSYGQVQLNVHGNQYENTIIWLIGEGYLEEVTFDNIMLDSQLELQLKTETLENCQDNDNIQATRANLMAFGDCYIQEPKTQCLSITNRCQTDCIHFQWVDQYPLSFSPQVGHLKPGQAKEVAITFNADKPVCLKLERVKCTIKKIIFQQPLSEIPDWDDRIHTIQWVDVEAPLDNNTRANSVTTVTTATNNKEKAHIDNSTRVSSQNKSGPSNLLTASTTTPTFIGPRKKKVIKTKPQPPCTEVSDSERNILLLVSGIADYCEYSCSTTQIHFKDTLMFQTRTYKFSIFNKGLVQMDYNWQVIMDTFRPSITDGQKQTNEGAPASPAPSPDSYVPFSIEPAFGTIAAKGTVNFTVKFSPLNITENSGHLICSVPNLPGSSQGPSIGVKGRSLMPYCHFELEDSDYIRTRRNPEMRGPGGAPPGAALDVNTRVVEIECIGIGVSVQKKFYILNPTNKAYCYEWISEDEMNPKNFTGFSCLSPKGNVSPGKQAEMLFEFKSREIGIAESFWRFLIPDQNIIVPFLLVSSVKDPDILLDRSHMRFKPVLLNHETTEIVHLVNNEMSAFQFAFDEGSCFSDGIPSKLSIEPMKGLVPPISRLPITFTFIPLNEKPVNFNVVCKVVGKVSPLQMNIKSEGYAMSCAVLCEDKQAIQIELTKWGLNEIDFSEVEINEKSTRIVTISNTGKFHFNYEWKVNDKANHLLSVSPTSGGVKYGSKDKCVITFCPKIKSSLNGAKMKLKISNGPTYQIVFNGSGIFPGLQFSFLSHNFGTCFIFKAGMGPKTATLRITNKDTKDISLDCLYTCTNQLMHNFKPDVLQPGMLIDVSFFFYPREAVKYKEIVTFEVNGLSTKTVEFLGEGCEMKVTVAESKHKIVKLGTHSIGSCTKRTIPIVNKSLASMTFNLQFSPVCTQLKDVISVTPSSTITLPAKVGTINIQVIFKPTTRIPQFSEEVFIDAAGYSQPLFVIQGSCLAMQLDLETDYIPFGAVVLQSYSTRKLVLSNTGDINARVHWDVEKFKPDFYISPVDSHVVAGKQILFDVIFKPQKILPDIRYENLMCFVNDGEYPPLKLTLTGTCASTPTSREVLHFQTFVRHKETKSIPISNRSNQQWDLRPIIDGNYWQGVHKFSVEPQSTKQYEITYSPMTMTVADNKKHTGSIFFPLPDGTAIFYSLTGIAEPPKPNGKISRDIPCKVHYTEPLTVYNWSKQSMRFKMKSEIMKTEKTDMSTTFKGMDYIDVPAGGQKEYRLEFHAYKEGLTCLRVTFTHTESGEYQFYELNFRSTKPSSVGLIELSSPVRNSVPHTINLENPLTFAVTFNINTNLPDLIVPGQVVIAPQSTRPVKIEFQPIKIGETSGKLELVSPELGLYLHDVNLKATPAGPERAIYMRTSLGQMVNIVAKFLNFAKQRTDYVCKVDNTDFHVDKSVAAAPGSPSGTEVAVDITFEPSRLGEQRATLTATSYFGGEYVFPLFGMCTTPKPQGPYVIKAGATICIVFRNVFNTNTTFTLQVDNELFHLPKKNESIRPHKDYRVIVGFDGNDSPSKADVMGKLIISCPRVTGDTTNVQWVYYLKGVTT
ncbi:HYDIN [Acanthosepion pharaonis]|uniref:HYDIN n=1 Tax=Acanthosepion pharaonis TaxID=158019 RepID=A0A812DLN9_ACAPH|nr:HYDIN [Sepia pharaonis]